MAKLKQINKHFVVLLNVKENLDRSQRLQRFLQKPEKVFDEERLSQHHSHLVNHISRSDLLVFVVPNELFNPQGGDFFKKVANDMQRVGQMVLVINKMSRETGETETLLSSVLQVIEPYHYKDFYTCFIDADSYLQARYETDEEEKTFLVGESNFDEFLNALQKLIERNELSAKLVTPLHKAVDLLEKSYNLFFQLNKN